MENESTKRKHNRSLRNLFVHRGNIRIVFGIPVLGLVCVLILLQTMKLALVQRTMELQDAHPSLGAPAQNFAETVVSTCNFATALIFVCTMMLATFGILITHRLYGPMIPILRSLKSFTAGDYTARGKLRPNDELQEIMNTVNELGVALESRYPKSSS